MSMAMRRGRRPLTWGADQGLRLWWTAEGEPATMQQAPSRALENPAIANYRFRALKVPPGAPRNDPDPVIAANTVGLAAAARGGRSESKRKGGTIRTAQGNLRRAPLPHWAYENGGGDYRHDTNLYVRFRCRS